MKVKRMRILLAEDNPADVWLIEEALKRQSIEFEIDNYCTAEDAIIAVGRCGVGLALIPDLLLVDYNLPTGHGGEILAAAGHNPHLSGVPKAILTSFLQPREMTSAMELGARCIITKPANLEEFMSEVGGKVAALLRGERIPGEGSAASNAR